MNEELRKQYWDYLVSKIFETINEVNDYNDKDILIMKLGLLANLNLMLESEEKFNDVISILRDNQNTKRFM